MKSVSKVLANGLIVRGCSQNSMTGLIGPRVVGLSSVAGSRKDMSGELVNITFVISGSKNAAIGYVRRSGLLVHYIDEPERLGQNSNCSA